MEQNGVIDAELKQQLTHNKDVMIECILHRHDQLSDNNNIAQGVAIIPTSLGSEPLFILGGIPSVMIDGIGALLGKKPKAYETLLNTSLNVGLVLGVPFYGLGKGISKMGTSVSKTFKTISNPNYCRYKLREQDSFAVKHKLMEKTAIPLF
eukprot:971124_1